MQHSFWKRRRALQGDKYSITCNIPFKMYVLHEEDSLAHGAEKRTNELHLSYQPCTTFIFYSANNFHAVVHNNISLI